MVPVLLHHMALSHYSLEEDGGRGREFMKPVVMLASYVTASKGHFGTFSLEEDGEGVGRTVGIASLVRELKKERVSGV